MSDRHLSLAPSPDVIDPLIEAISGLLDNAANALDAAVRELEILKEMARGFRDEAENLRQ